MRSVAFNRIQIFQQTAREIRDYVFNYCTQNDNIHAKELEELLSDVLDEEFNTICEDNSAIGKWIGSNVNV